MSLRHVAGLVTLFAFLSACQPAPEVLEAPTSAIDAERLLSHVETLSSDAYMGRRAGTDGGAMAVAYVQGRMEEMGLAPACGENLRQPFSFEGRSGAVQAVNLIAKIPGTSPGSGAIVLSAHFDHLGQRGTDVFNGADDNASGTAVLLEIARVVAGKPLSHDLVLAAVDAEEMGLRGARHFVASECFDGLNVRLNINMDMVSRSADGELYASGTRHYPFLKPVLESIATSDSLTLLFGHDEPGTGADDWTNASDHAPFHAAGIPFVYFGVEDHAGYHNPGDVFDDITPAFFEAAAGFILEAVRALDASASGFPRS